MRFALPTRVAVIVAVAPFGCSEANLTLAEQERAASSPVLIYQGVAEEGDGPRWLCNLPGCNNPGYDAQPALQSCLDDGRVAPGATVTLPRGCTATLYSQLAVTRTVRLRTDGTVGEPRCWNRVGTQIGADSGRCATLRAGWFINVPPGQQGGMVRAQVPGGAVTLDHLILDGNGPNVQGGNTRGAGGCDFFSCANLIAMNLFAFVFTNSVSMRSGVNNGSTYSVYIQDVDRVVAAYDLIWRNGNSPVRAGWQQTANGFEAVAFNKNMWAAIFGNDSIDNSDGGLVVSGRAGQYVTGELSWNNVLQMFSRNYSGILLYQSDAPTGLGHVVFGQGGARDHDSGFLVHHNYVDCNYGGLAGRRACCRGLALGVHEWVAPCCGKDLHGVGGSVYNNVVSHSRIGYQIDGWGQGIVGPGYNYWVDFTANGAGANQYDFSKTLEAVPWVLGNEVAIGGAAYYGNALPPGWSAQNEHGAAACSL
jgi:hypothetical protein